MQQSMICSEKLKITYFTEKGGKEEGHTKTIGERNLDIQLYLLLLRDELKHLSRSVWLQKRYLYLWHCNSYE